MEKSRRIEYLTYAVDPSEADFQEAESWINDIKADFESTENNIQFVNSNSDVGFEDVWYKKEDLPEILKLFLGQAGLETLELKICIKCRKGFSRIS